MKTRQDVAYIGWAVERPGRDLFVEYGCTEADAWKFAFGYPSAAEIEWHKKQGARAFQVQIREILKS